MHKFIYNINFFANIYGSHLNQRQLYSCSNQFCSLYHVLVFYNVYISQPESRRNLQSDLAFIIVKVMKKISNEIKRMQGCLFSNEEICY